MGVYALTRILSGTAMEFRYNRGTEFVGFGCDDIEYYAGLQAVSDYIGNFAGNE